MFLLGSDVIGDGSARFVVFVPSIFLHVWRDWGGVICLGGSNDVPDELANGGVQAESDPIALRQSWKKPSGGIPLLLAPPSNKFPLNGVSMGLARGWIELEG